MKNYSKAAPRRDSSSAMMKSNQSLFMDESSEDLENYLNTPLTQSSTVTSDQVLLFEEDTGSPAINILSRNIKGQFLKTFSRPRKNKFFKSKTSLDKEIIVSNEIPVINEAMKKIFKGTSLSPNTKHSPKVLKTYSNKRKEKPVVESFGLPDEPLLKLDVVQSEEQDSIDLETTHDNDNIDISSFSPWKPPYQIDCSDNTITEDFRRRSFSTPENISCQINFEKEVKEGFSFEDDHLVQVTHTKTDVLVKDKKLIVSLEQLNFRNTLLRPNGLSHLKNEKQSLIANTESKLRNPRDHAEQQVGKSDSETSKFADSPKNNSCMRRSTRLNKLLIETGGPSTSELSNLDSSVELNCESIKLINNSKENQQERKEELISGEPLNTDVFSPRRSSRISGVQGVLSSPLNKLNEKSSPIKKSRDNRDKTNNENIYSKFEDVEVSLKSPKSVDKHGNKFRKNVDVLTPEENLNSTVNNVNGIIKNGVLEKFVEPIGSSSPRKSDRLQSKSQKVDENQTETKMAKDKEQDKLKTSIDNHDIQEMKSPVKKQSTRLRPQFDNIVLLPKHSESTELNRESDKKVPGNNFSKKKNETIASPKKQKALRRSGRKSMAETIDELNKTDDDHNIDKKQINGIIKEKTRGQISQKFEKIENTLNDQVNDEIKISKNITTNSFQKESSVDISIKICHERRNDKEKELTTSQTFNYCKNPQERGNSSDSKFNSPKHIVLENILENPSLAPSNLEEIEFSINITRKQKDEQTIVPDKNIACNKIEKILIQNNFHEGIHIEEETENSINDKLKNTSLDESVKKLDESSAKISDNGIEAFIKDNMKNQRETVNPINEKESQNATEISALVKKPRGRPRKKKNLHLYHINKVEKCVSSNSVKSLTKNDDNKKIEANIKDIDNKEDLKNKIGKCESMNGIDTLNVSPNSEKFLTKSEGNKIEANTENIDKKQDSKNEIEKCDSMNGTNTSNVSPNLNDSEKSLTKNDDKIEPNTKNIDKNQDSNCEKEEEIVFSSGNTKSVKKKKQIGEDKILLHQQITQFDGIKYNGDLVNKIIKEPQMFSLEMNNSKVLDNCESIYEKSCSQNSDSHEATNSNSEEENKNEKEFFTEENQISDTFTECEHTSAGKNEHNIEIHQNINSNNPDLGIGTESNNSTKNESEKTTNKHEHLDETISSEITKEKQFTVSEINAGQTNGIMDVLDFGYDIHRRTSFRKILEKVMEVSRLEMEAKKSETARLHRCKSVPHEEFRSKKEINQTQFMSYSSDSKIRYLKEKKINCLNIEYSKIKKHLNFDQDIKSLPRKRTKSMSSGLTKQPKLVENILKPLQEKEDEKIKDKINDKVLEAEEMSKTDNFINSNVEHEESNVESKNKVDFSKKHDEYSEENDIDQDDLEVANLLETETSCVQSNMRRRSRSISDGAHRKRASLSALGRRSKGHGRAGTPHFKLIKKVHEFKIGDLVWSKIGNYPYWPALIVEDPETSDFKKFKLLRATPYYHVRYFGDKGKRAWTVRCFPYEGQDDLEKLREKCFVEGYQSGDYQVKWSYKEKWYRAVQEAESIKNAPLETKLSFFDQPFKKQEKTEHKDLESLDYPADIPSRARSKSMSFITKDSKMGVKKNFVQSLVNRDLIRPGQDIVASPHDSSISQGNSLVSSPKKRNISMKDSSVHSCIDNVITKYCSDQVKDSTPNSLKRKRKKSGANRIASDSEYDIGIDSKKIVKAKSPERKTNKIKGSPTSDTDDSEFRFESLDVSIKNVSPDSTKRKCGDISDTPLQNSTPKSSKRKTKNDQIEDEQLETATELDSSVILKTSRRALRKSNSNQTENKSEIRQNKLESPVKDSTLESTKRKTRKPKNYLNEDDNDESDLGLELLDVPILENSSKKPEFSPKIIRSRFSARIGQKKNSQEYEQEVKPQESSNECVSHLPEYKKNLFRGVPKERICQICEKPGDVVKCRGPCNGDFHMACNEKSFKDTEELTVKVEELPVKEEKSDSVSSQEEVMVDNNQVEISTVVSRKKFADNVILSPVNKKIPLMEQFDRKMKEMMSQVESRIIKESSESSSDEIQISDNPKTVENLNGNNSKKRKSFMHVTADCDNELSKLIHNPNENLEQINSVDEGVYKCSYCVSTVIPPCFVCNSVVSKKGNSMRQRCSQQKCGKYYHLECLNIWRQTQWSFILHDGRKRKTEALDSFVCPRHSCHICTSENLGFSMGRCPNDKLVKCLRCPATYHNSYHCIPAGSDILTSTQIVCPRHVEGNRKNNTLNTTWCFVCSEGGNLICCETCPTSVHVECLPVNLLEDDTYICEECECGRFPLYDEVVWVKCGCFRWWPAIILFPSDIPSNVESKPHKKGEFVVKFFGTYNHFWVGRGRVFLYQEGDTGYMNNNKNKIDEAFSTALREAADAYRFKKGLRAKKQEEVNNGLKPPPYVRIKVNRPVGKVKVFEGNLSNTTPCDCDPKDESPCGPNSNCLNRILLTECNPEICPAGQRCKNQCFEKREYPQLAPHRTAQRGWGLKTLEPIKKGRFVIEYVGEIIDDEEYQRRITRMHQQKDENYYFLTIDKDRMLDAGPKGNMARFMNHSCQPNCETQKWTVNGDTRVGLFAIENIPADSELTFNYNLECVGTEKKVCRCGAPNCSGFIGLKPVNSDDPKPTKKNSSVKPSESEKQDMDIRKDSCFICGKGANLGKCSNKSCSRSYHLECVQLDSWPDGKWNCPSHSCNICSKRTWRICVLCNNSYCLYHSNGNIKHDDSLGYICNDHNQTKRKSLRRSGMKNGSQESTFNEESKSSRKKEVSEGTSSRSERYRKRASCFEVNISPKRAKVEK